jgi:hypothetical protein
MWIGHGSGLLGLILILALATNVTVNTKFPEHADRFPFIGVSVWVAILMSAGVHRPDWEVLPGALRSSIFLLSVVLIASMMPVERLPPGLSAYSAGPWFFIRGIR